MQTPKLTAGTVIRGILMLLSLLYLAVTTFRPDLLPSGTAADGAATTLTGVVFLWSYWKNNSLTKAAQTADAFLSHLKSQEESDEQSL